MGLDRQLPEGLQQLGGSDGLADVALGVLCAVDEEADDGGGEGGAADGAGLVEGVGGDEADAAGGLAEGGAELGEDDLGEGVGGLLGVEAVELGAGEGVAFGIGEEAVEAAGDVAEVEGYGGKAVGVCVHLGVGERGDPACGVLAGKLEGVKYLAAGGVDLGEGVAEPGLWFGLWELGFEERGGYACGFGFGGHVG
jgi:hypothetical protein